MMVAPAPPIRFRQLTETALRLLNDDPQTGRFTLPRTAQAQRRLLRALLTVREPAPLDPELMAVLDALLAGERRQRALVNARALKGPIAVWRGDITTLMADAIVNAANSALLGCFQPMHGCVDNAIHAAAGPRLRADCHQLMSAQNHPEPTGSAKITRGHHLPAQHVLHTVGPVVHGELLPEHEQQLASSYRACLDLAARTDEIRTIAFSGISTGVFGFPKHRAAQIAVRTVRDWMATHHRFDRVVFVTYTDLDHAAYPQELR